MKTRIWPLAVAILIIASLLLAGCGGTSNNTVSTTKTTTSTQASTGTAQTTTSTSPGAVTQTTTSTSSTTTKTTIPTSTTSTGQNLSEILGVAAGITSVKYDMVTTGTGMPTTTQTMYIKGKKIRMEMSAEGQSVVNIIDGDAQVMYMYMPDENTAMKMDFGQAPQSVTDEAQEISGKQPTVVGTETIDGKVCVVIEYVDTQATVKSWIWKEKGLPVRSEIKTSEGTTTIDYKNFDFSNLDDSLFQLPEGVEIMDIGGLIPTNLPTNIP
jgi:hypothetical protein